MTILIDEARWWHRGRRWCHLVSDESLDELHEFAAAVGIPRRGFQGDHYDVPEEYREEMIEAGAAVVESRELLRRLKAAGLRLSPSQRRAASGGITHDDAAHDATDDDVVRDIVGSTAPPTDRSRR